MNDACSFNLIKLTLQNLKYLKGIHISSAKYCLPITSYYYFFHYICLVPTFLRDINVLQLNGTHMNVSWSYIPLSDAKGFVLFYNILYETIADERNRQASNISVPGNESSALIGSLSPSQSYQVFVGATTSAGDGQYSSDPVMVPSKLTYIMLFNLYQHRALYICIFPTLIARRKAVLTTVKMHIQASLVDLDSRS